MAPPWKLAIDDLECCLLLVFAVTAVLKLDLENPDDPFDKIPQWDESVNGKRLGGKEFMASLMDPPRIGEGDANWQKREAAILEQITKGNIPDFMRQPQYVHMTFMGKDGQMHVASYRVMPDYLAIGTNDDYVVVPMSGTTAQKICDQMGFTLPTAQMVDQIYGTAKKNGGAITGEPREYYLGKEQQADGSWKVTHAPRLPDTSDPAMADLQKFRQDKGLDSYSDGQKAQLQTSTWAFAEHDLAIKDGAPPRFDAEGNPILWAGHKKDIIAAEHGPGRDNKLAIYGLYDKSGVPMNATTTGAPFYSHHSQEYTDYSHGARMVDQYMVLDGQIKKVSEVMADPNVASGLTGLEGEMKNGGRVPGVTPP